MRIKSITIKNFKNLKDITVYPEKFNVIVGPNGSGKTNFIEFFKLLRKILIEGIPYPFVEWDGYENVVWKKERLPIEFGFELEENSKEYSICFSIIGSGYGSLKFLSAKFQLLDGNVEISLEFLEDGIEFTYNRERFKIECNGIEIFEDIIELFREEILRGNFDSYWDGVFVIFDETIEYDKSFEDFLKKYFPKRLEDLKKISLGESSYKSNVKAEFLDIFLEALKPLEFFFKRDIIILFTIPANTIKKKAKIFPLEAPLKEDGINVLDILAATQFRDGKLPRNIEYFVETFFDGRVYFKGRLPGRLDLFFWDNKLKIEISKESLPSGLIKGLVILTALNQSPNVLLIDEIENSLHPELLHFLIKELRESESYVFVTTHNPEVLKMVNPEEILLFKPKEDGSVEVKRVTDYRSKEELERELEELGITLGEKVFYGMM